MFRIVSELIITASFFIDYSMIRKSTTGEPGFFNILKLSNNFRIKHAELVFYETTVSLDRNAESIGLRKHNTCQKG